MAEEHRCQAPRLCANNCGFFGSPATLDLCSKCYRDLQLKEQQSSSARLALDQTLLPSTTASLDLSLPQKPTSSTAVQIHEKRQEEKPAAEAAAAAVVQTTAVNRCMTCRRRVGLTGFKCRCGLMFCGTHRYPEQHQCSFDFKEVGKAQIAKANPVVKGQKLNKI